MTEATSSPSSWGIAAHDLELLVVRGRLKGALTMDDVVLVLQTVELTTEVIEGIRTLLLEEGIILDETVPQDDLETLEAALAEAAADAGEPIGGRLPPSVEAELHEAAEAAAHAMGDFEQDGPELAASARPARPPPAAA